VADDEFVLIAIEAQLRLGARTSRALDRSGCPSPSPIETKLNDKEQNNQQYRFREGAFTKQERQPKQ
jgi:hypothetical protein